jgi:mxaJ protein
MSSRCLERLALVLGLALACCVARAAGDARVLRVCADPDNLPYSHEDQSGFENRIAGLIAADLNATLEYTWLPQRRGFVRKTIGEGLCDLWMGVPADFERMLTTRPYYRSSYVFVFREEREPGVRSFDDPRLQGVRAGVQLVGNDLAATPPGHALALRGAVRNVAGFPVFGEQPAAQRMIAALVTRDIDVALIWGPQAGFFARQAKTKLGLSPAIAPPELKHLPFEFSIAIGVKRGERELVQRLDAVLDRRQSEIDAILSDYAVPRTDRPAGAPLK